VASAMVVELMEDASAVAATSPAGPRRPSPKAGPGRKEEGAAGGGYDMGGA
jgi:hypothetical protein